MKILIVTIPLRAEPTAYAPIGALSVINHIRKNSADDVSIELFNIDAHRPEFTKAVEYIRDFRPDILGISAVVSTAYDYTKRLIQAARPLLPDMRVVVGGNLGASAEVLLRGASVDLCVLGEGEKVFLNVVNHYKANRPRSDLAKIPGIAFLDDSGTFVNSGYEEALPAAEVWDVDWTDIERDGTMDLYFPTVTEELVQTITSRTDEHRINLVKIPGKRTGFLTCAKGCVARCTFCHRWDKGIRHIPLDVVFKRLDELI
ncbi:MAG: cobalamin-dependent protein, partial [Acidobacteriota bacterium]